MESDKSESNKADDQLANVVLIDPNMGEILPLMFKPAELVARIPLSGGFKRPLIFSWEFGILLSVVGLLSDLFGNQLDLRAACLWTIYAIANPLILLVFSAYQHVFSKLFGGKGSFEASFRVQTYSYVAGLLGSLPWVGIFIAIYATYVFALALKKAHSFGTGRVIGSLVVSAIPLLVIFLLCILYAGQIWN